ncbi:hypothetical protein HJC23_008349 [Cyclotella cryptica]|uniref:Uncharacterized protein n=1 Tax=Cyclotella cryptica TaxID=29204 RepID=A0ABD3Q475_9STRA
MCQSPLALDVRVPYGSSGRTRGDPVGNRQQHTNNTLNMTQPVTAFSERLPLPLNVKLIAVYSPDRTSLCRLTKLSRTS